MFVLVCGLILSVGLYLIIKNGSEFKWLGYCLTAVGLIALIMLFIGVIKLPLK